MDDHDLALKKTTMVTTGDPPAANFKAMPFVQKLKA
jgi:hypothetical protein